MATALCKKMQRANRGSKFWGDSIWGAPDDANMYVYVKALNAS